MLRTTGQSQHQVFMTMQQWRCMFFLVGSVLTLRVLAQPALAPVPAYAAGLPFNIDLRVAIDATEASLSHEDRIRVVDGSIACGQAGSGAATSNSYLRGILAENPHSPGETGESSPAESSLVWPDLRLMRAGSYRVCLCRNRGASCVTDVLFGVSVGVLVVSGPTSIVDGASSALAPVAGRMFNIQVKGIRLSSQDRLRILPQQVPCGSVVATKDSLSLTESGLDLSGRIGTTGDGLTSQVWPSLVLVDPGTYNVCWCSSLSAMCASGADFSVLAGNIIVLGPLSVKIPGGNVTVATPFALQLIGRGLSIEDRIRIGPREVPCGQPGSSTLLAPALSGMGAFVVHAEYQALEWRNLQLAHAKEYRVCWCSLLADDCLTDFDFNVNAGSFDVLEAQIPSNTLVGGLPASQASSVNASAPCRDDISWQSAYGADCAWFAQHDPGCTKTADIGQRLHCNSTCQTCIPKSDPLETTCSLGPICACLQGCSPSVPCPVGVMGATPTGNPIAEECTMHVLADSGSWKIARPTQELPWHEWKLPTVEEIHGLELNGNAGSGDHTTTFAVQVLAGNHTWRVLENGKEMAANWDGKHSVQALFSNGPVQTHGIRLEPRDYSGSPFLTASLVVRRCTIPTPPSPDWRCHALKCQAYCFRQFSCRGKWVDYCEQEKQASLAWELNAAQCDVDCNAALGSCFPSLWAVLLSLLVSVIGLQRETQSVECSPS